MRYYYLLTLLAVNLKARPIVLKQFYWKILFFFFFYLELRNDVQETHRKEKLTFSLSNNFSRQNCAALKAPERSHYLPRTFLPFCFFPPCKLSVRLTAWCDTKQCMGYREQWLGPSQSFLWTTVLRGQEISRARCHWAPCRLSSWFRMSFFQMLARFCT